MKKPIFTTTLLMISLLMISCNNDISNQVLTDKSEVTSANTNKTDSSSSNSRNKNSGLTEKNLNNADTITPKAGDGQPKVTTIKSMVQEDLKCYVTLIDEQGKPQEIGASFEICAQEQTFLNKIVNLRYDIVNVNDCQSNEPCGKTKKESLIIQMDVIDNSESRKSSGDAVTLSNGE